MLFFKLSPLESVQSGSSLQSLGRLRRGLGSLSDIPALGLRHGQVSAASAGGARLCRRVA